MKNSEKIILDLCGGTGSWSEPYRKAGYDVRLITMPDWDVKQWNKHDVWPLKEIVFLHTSHAPGSAMVIPIEKIYGILAAPPCTQFSRARTTAKTPRDLKGSLEVVQSCIDLAQTIKSTPDNTLKFWALENPMSMLRQLLGKPPHSFRGWEWGDKHMKFTDLWGYYRMPTKKIKTPPAGFDRTHWASPKKPKKYQHLVLDRAAIRAITPPGFAKAFMEANR